MTSTYWTIPEKPHAGLARLSTASLLALIPDIVTFPHLQSLLSAVSRLLASGVLSPSLGKKDLAREPDPHCKNDVKPSHVALAFYIHLFL